MGWRTEEAGVGMVFQRGRCMNGKMEGEVRGTMFLGRACLKYVKVMNFALI